MDRSGGDEQLHKIVFTTRSVDGDSEAVVTLQEHKDPTKPPFLINVTKRPLEQQLSYCPPEQRKTHVIISTGSGDKCADAFFSSVVRPILESIYGETVVRGMKIHTTQSPASILELTDDVLFPTANEGRPIRIILLSGDGGIVDLVNGLSSKSPNPQTYIPPQVVILPLGTANALYHSMNAGGYNIWGLSALASSKAKPLPTFTATFSPGARRLVDEGRQEQELPKDEHGNGIVHGAVVASWGMHASLVGDSDTTEYRKHGVERFKMAAKEALYPADGSPPHPYKGKVSILKENPDAVIQEGAQWTTLPEEEHMYVLATMVSHLEKPFCISPKSKPLDGSMHLVHFGPRSGDAVMSVMNKAYDGGKHVDEEDVRYESIDGLRIEFEGKEDDGRWRRICIDGQIVRVEKDGWVEIRKAKIGKREERVLDVVVVE
jgi:diacylglycerol kinase family enzyme